MHAMLTMYVILSVQNVKGNKEEHEKLAKDIKSLADILPRELDSSMEDSEYVKVVDDMDR
jgi:hypothetical protein